MTLARIMLHDLEWRLNIGGWSPAEAANMAYCFGCLIHGENW